MSRVAVEQKVLSENQRIAAELRERFRQHNILCVNLISSPAPARHLCWSAPWEALPVVLGSRSLQVTFKLKTMRAAWRPSAFRRNRSRPAAPAIWTRA